MSISGITKTLRMVGLLAAFVACGGVAAETPSPAAARARTSVPMQQEPTLTATVTPVPLPKPQTVAALAPPPVDPIRQQVKFFPDLELDGRKIPGRQIAELSIQGHGREDLRWIVETPDTLGLTQVAWSNPALYEDLGATACDGAATCSFSRRGQGPAIVRIEDRASGSSYRYEVIP